MADANQRIFDATIRHQVDLRRFTQHEVDQVLAILDKADAELARRLRARMGPRFTIARLRALLDDLYVARNEDIARFQARLREDVVALGRGEAEFEAKMVRTHVPFAIELAGVQQAALRASILGRPFHGRKMQEWFQTIKRNDRRAVTDAMQVGLARGEGVDQIIRRVIGTSASRYSDGAVAITRNAVDTLVRTAVNHASNAARDEFFTANSDIILALRVTATLDGRTSPFCRAHDGDLVMVGDKAPPEGSTLLVPQGARPPFHPRCRTVMVVVLDGEGLVGRRPFVADARKPDERLADFRAEARATGRSIGDVRSEWAAKNVGTVPAETTYAEWFAKQDAALQRSILGDARYALYKKGDLSVDRFVDPRGNTLTLDQLAAREPAAWTAAGLGE